MRLTNNILRSKVDLYHNTSTLSASTGTPLIGAGTEYPTAFATGVRASVQPQKPQAGVHADFQPGTTEWRVIFGSSPGLNPADLIVWTDNSGTVRYLVVSLVRDLAGISSAWEALCWERLPS